MNDHIAALIISRIVRKTVSAADARSIAGNSVCLMDIHAAAEDLYPGVFSDPAVFTAADGGTVGSAGGIDLTAVNQNGSGRCFIAAADAGAAVSSVGFDRAAADDDLIRPAAVPAAADPGCVGKICRSSHFILTAADRFDIAAVDDDLAAVFAFITAADAGAVFISAGGDDLTAVDLDSGNRAAVFTAADAGRIPAAPGIDFAAVDDDISERSVFRGTDAGTAVTSGRFHNTAVDRNTASGIVLIASDCRPA